MKLKFGHKVFFAFLLNGLVMVVCLLVIFRFYAVRNFETYVGNMEEERLKDLAEALGREYVKGAGWAAVVEDLDQWVRLHTPVPPDGPGWRPPEDLPSGGPPEGPHGRPGPPPPGFPGSVRRPDERGNHGPPFSPEGGRPEGPAGLHRPPDEHGDHGPPFPPGGGGLEGPEGPGDPWRRVVLFDSDKRPLTGNETLPEEEYRLKPVTVDDRVVGWVGIRKFQRPTHPLDLEFLKVQRQTLYTVGGVALLLAICVTAVLTRHILRPVRDLAEGTRALTSRRFDTRIGVRSDDEFGRLIEGFNDMAHALERYEEMRRQWMADISHELRTPLSILRGEIEAMQDGVRPVDREALDSLHAEVEHVSRIVNDLQDLSLIESHARDEEWTPVDPYSVLEETLGSFGARLGERGLRVVVEEPEGGAARVLADEFRLMQLFANLTENALRYATAPGTLKVRRRLAGEEISIDFEDSGPGVPEASLSRLFDRLYRVDKARSRASGGSGLGLAICKGIVESFGGRIEATNGTLGGLRIIMNFPVLDYSGAAVSGETAENG